MKLFKKEASKLLRSYINVPARTISRTMKKNKIETMLSEYNITVKIK